ncbi:MAG: tetratricopeptide repeat protein [Planctomycetes bacterium]|nr:tetratricopeptide repeat protein [Planctomycetota bacterium]
MSLLLLGASCSSLDEREEAALNIYKQNSKSYYNSGRYDEAIDQCNKGIELDPDDFSLNLTLGWSLLRAEGTANLFAAYEQFQTALGLNWFDEDYRAVLGLGQTCFKIATLYNQKLSDIEQRIEKNQEAAAVFQEEIDACREGKIRYLEEAIDRLQEVLKNERQKENIDALLTLGQAYAYSGEENLAVDSLIHGLDLLEKSTSFQQKKLDSDTSITGDGRRFFERQIRRNLKWERELRGLLAYIFQRQENHEQALEQFRIMEARDLFDNVQYYNYGVSLQALGRYEKAIEAYEMFLNLASVSGKQFDEDEHFHLAFERINACREALKKTSRNRLQDGPGPRRNQPPNHSKET